MKGADFAENHQCQEKILDTTFFLLYDTKGDKNE